MSKYFHDLWSAIFSSMVGMGITLKHMFLIRKGNVTLQYPEEKWPRPERKIGYDLKDYNVIRSRLHHNIDDCTGCNKCARACPVGRIKVETMKVPKGTDLGTTSNDTIKRLLVTRFDIDMTECMYCNLCTYPCPEECIFMTGGPNSSKHPLDYEYSEYDRRNLVFNFAKVTQEEIDKYTIPPPEEQQKDEVESS